MGIHFSRITLRMMKTFLSIAVLVVSLAHVRTQPTPEAIPDLKTVSVCNKIGEGDMQKSRCENYWRQVGSDRDIECPACASGEVKVVKRVEKDKHNNYLDTTYVACPNASEKVLVDQCE